MSALASLSTLEYFLCVSRSASICDSSSMSTVRVVLPSFSRMLWREHLYVEMVQFFHSSSLTDGVWGVPFGPTVVEPGLASGTDVVAA